MKKEPTKKELKEWIKNERNVFLNSFFDLLNQRKELEQKVQRLQKQLKEANELLLDFCSENECRFDHNGYCQEHDSCEGEYKCIQKDLKQYLEKWGVK